MSGPPFLITLSGVSFSYFLKFFTKDNANFLLYSLKACLSAHVLIGFRIFLSTPSHSVGIYKLNPGISSYLT
jgi:hypothetical protein